MKKVLSLILTLVLLIGSVALAEIDLTGMSFNELRILYEQVQQALIDTKQGGTVKVGIGVYEVGKDIPAGKWTVTVPGNNCAFVYIFPSYEAYLDSEYNFLDFQLIYSTEYSKLREGSNTEMNMTIREGQCIRVEDATVYFTPFDSLTAGFFD